jgi:hypothetical protein
MSVVRRSTIFAALPPEGRAGGGFRPELSSNTLFLLVFSVAAGGFPPL